MKNSIFSATSVNIAAFNAAVPMNYAADVSAVRIGGVSASLPAGSLGSAGAVAASAALVGAEAMTAATPAAQTAAALFTAQPFAAQPFAAQWSAVTNPAARHRRAPAMSVIENRYREHSR